MKKYLTILAMVLLMVMITFTGCGGGDSSDDEGDNDETETSDVLEDLTDLFSKSDDYERDGISYTQTMTMEDMTYTITVSTKEDLYKTETSMEGQEVVTIINYETGETIMYYPQSKTGTKFTTEDDMDDVSDSYDINDFQEQVDPVDFENLGMETINGENCYVIESTDLTTSSSVKMWVSEKYGILMKMEGTDETSGETFGYEITEIIVGVDDSEFEVPSDIVLQSFSF